MVHYMKTLFVDINNKPIQNTDEIICISDNGTLQNAFFYELGCFIQSKSGINVPKSQLISDFNSPENAEAYANIIEQWERMKAILFSSEVEGKYQVSLSKEYISWLANHSNEDYRSICKRKHYDCTRELTITIDIKEFYDEYIGDDFFRILMKTLYENNDIDNIVFNDNAITKNSIIYTSLRKQFNISLQPYEMWLGLNIKTTNNVFIGKTRVVATNVPYSHIGVYSCGRCLVRNAETKLFGYIDEEGKEVIPCRYREALQFIKGYAWTLYGACDEWVIIDLSGQYVANTRCSKSDVLKVKYGIICCNDNAYYEYNGKCIAHSDKQTKIQLNDFDGQLVISRNGHQNRINLEPNLIPTNYQIKKINDRFGVRFDNIDSVITIIPFEYKKIEYLQAGYFKLVDNDDNQIICKYQEIMN